MAQDIRPRSDRRGHGLPRPAADKNDSKRPRTPFDPPPETRVRAPAGSRAEASDRLQTQVFLQSSSTHSRQLNAANHIPDQAADQRHELSRPDHRHGYGPPARLQNAELPQVAAPLQHQQPPRQSQRHRFPAFLVTKEMMTAERAESLASGRVMIALNAAVSRRRWK
jgi:hypothetical protein